MSLPERRVAVPFSFLGARMRKSECLAGFASKEVVNLVQDLPGGKGLLLGSNWSMAQEHDRNEDG